MTAAAPWEAIDRALADVAQVDLSWIEPAPTADGCTLAPDALRFLTKLVEILQPQHILELGSGLSTRVLSRAAGKLSSKCVISSVDHDPQYNWGILEPEGEANVSFQLAPLVVREFGGKLLGAYMIQPEKLATKQPVDLVLIDGPPVNLGGREGTLYQVMDFAQPGTVVLLDDAKRPDERAALKTWEENLRDAITLRQLPGFAKGMAAAVIQRPVTTRELWEHRFALCKREIEKHVPEDQMVLIAGESWWAQELELARRVLPFTEKEGRYWGEPADDASAVAELERLVGQGARYMIFGWPAFWWLEHYQGLTGELERRGRRVLENDRLVMFDLRV